MSELDRLVVEVHSLPTTMCPSLNMHLRVDVLLLLLFLSCLRFLLLAQPTLGLGSTNTNPNITAVTNSSFFISKPGCQLNCGDITVPYPFGIGNDSACSISSWLHLTCNTSYDPPKLFLGGLQVLSISQTKVRVQNTVAVACYNQAGNLANIDNPAGMQWGVASPYTFSDTENKLTVVGCNVFALISWSQQGREFSTGCLSTCSNGTDVVAGNNCTGFGCCQSNIPMGLKNFDVSLGLVSNHTQVWTFVF